MRKKLGGERGYLALEDIRIKSKFLRSNMPIREVGRSGGEKKSEREEKEEEEGSAKKVDAGVKTPPVTGAKLTAMSPPRVLRA